MSLQIAKPHADASLPPRRWLSTALWLGAVYLVGGAIGAAQAATCRVTAGGASGNDGSSWAQSMDLPSALANPACGEVWVAEGVYKPTSGADRTATFAIRSGVAVYGGFAGSESGRDERDPALHRSVLSGDIGGDDVVDAHGITASAADIAGDNSYHVASLDDASADTVLDGFTLTGGQANGTDSIETGVGGGLICNGSGAGRACSPNLRNLVVRGNSAAAGGGLGCVAQAQGRCDAELENAAFVGNAAGMGGALMNAGIDAGVASPRLRNVTFSGNNTEQGAGTFTNFGNGGTADATLVNVTFSDNSAASGGAVANLGMDGIAKVTIANAILWGNTPDEVVAQNGTTTLSHSILQGACPAEVSCTDTVVGNPHLGALQDGAMPVVLPGIDSVALDAVACDDAPASDARGIVRPQGTRCDVGAAEVRQAHLVIDVSGNGKVAALGAPAPLGAPIADCRQGSGDCSAWYRVEPDAPAVALTLRADAGHTLQSASGCGGALAGILFTTAALQGDCTVAAVFAPTARAIGGTVTGLAGNGLVLTLNGSESLPIAADGTFSFDTTLTQGAAYAVTIAVQPSQPSQTCLVVNGSGTVGDGDVTNVVIHCGAAVTYSVGGSLGGLAPGASLTLSINGGSELTLAANGAYVFALRFAPGESYLVAVATQPVGQHCTLGNASGTVGGANVTDVEVTCSAGGARLELSVTDHGDYARYGQVRDYFVTLANTGNDSAYGVGVGADLDAAAFDVANVQWACVGGAPGASCTGQGAGGFADTATLLAGTQLVWIVRVPVRGDSGAATATFAAHADGASAVQDRNTLVIFRDGLDVAYADGAGVVDPARREAADAHRSEAGD